MILLRIGRVFDISSVVNKWLPVGRFAWLGRFEGRKEGTITLDTDDKAFVYVINGAFEVQNRLLVQRDGMGLTGTRHVEMEALSEEANILVIVA